MNALLTRVLSAAAAAAVLLGSAPAVAAACTDASDCHCDQRCENSLCAGNGGNRAAGEACDDGGAGRCMIDGTCCKGAACYDLAGNKCGATTACPAPACRRPACTAHLCDTTNANDGDACAGGFCCVGSCNTAGGCCIGGTAVQALGVNPGNHCEACLPLVSKTDWTGAEGADLPCPAGQVCHDGGGPIACVAGCSIVLVFVAPNTNKPGNACQRCDPATDVHAWTNKPDITGCGSGKICCDGSCGTGACCIDKVVYATGVDPSNDCRSCAPATSATGWTPKADETTCMSDGISCTDDHCTSGVCQHTAVTDGTPCGAGHFCFTGACGSGCSISGTAYRAGTIDATNSCRVCDPVRDAAGWSNVAVGTPCLTIGTCYNGTCVQTAETICDDQQDNDTDGLTDCADPNCLGKACDQCRSGSACIADGGCAGGVPVSCPDDTCRTGGACSSATGECGWATIHSGVACTPASGSCGTGACDLAGTCVPDCDAGAPGPDASLLPDAGPADAQAVDLDASAMDAGTADAEFFADAEAVPADAEPPPADAAVLDGSARPSYELGGCGCSSAGALPWLAVVAGLGGLVWRRRRRVS